MHIIIFGASGTEFSPLGLMPEVWYRSDLSVSLSGSTVTAWGDQSGNGRNLSASGSPQLRSADINGHDAVELTGASLQRLQSASFTAVSQPLHVFAVLNQPTWLMSDVLYALDGLSNYLGVLQSGSSPDVRHFAGWATTNTVSPTLNTYYLLQSYWNGASSFQQLNNSAAVSGGNPGPQSMTRVTLGARHDGATSGNVKFAELAIYGSQITGGDLSNLTSYFNARYSLW